MRHVGGIHGQRTIEIVDDEQQLEQQVDNFLIRLLAAFALDALPVVVELGRLAHPAVLIVVALALQVGHLIGRNECLGRPDVSTVFSQFPVSVYDEPSVRRRIDVTRSVRSCMG